MLIHWKVKTSAPATDDEKFIVFNGCETVEILYFEALLLMQLRVWNLSDFWEVTIEALYFEIFEVWGLVFNHLNLNQIT